MSDDEIRTLCNEVVNEVAGHLPYNFPDEYVLLVRRCAKWGFDQVVAPVLEGDQR